MHKESQNRLLILCDFLPVYDFLLFMEFDKNSVPKFPMIIL